MAKVKFYYFVYIIKLFINFFMGKLLRFSIRSALLFYRYVYYETITFILIHIFFIRTYGYTSIVTNMIIL